MLGVAFLVTGVLCIVIGVLLYKQGVFSNIKSQTDCETRSKLPTSCQNDSTCCGVWHNGSCLKGKVSGNTCTAGGNAKSVLTFILIIAGIALIVYGIYKLIKKEQMQ